MIKLWYILRTLLNWLVGLFTPSEEKGVAAERDNLPLILRGAKLVLNEENIRTTRPTPLHGRIDQCLQTVEGFQVPVDTKTRKRPKVKLSDVIQLSVYGTILRNTSRKPVHHQGYIRNVHPETEEVTYLPVTLLNDNQVVELAGQYRSLKSQQCSQVKINQSECWFCRFRTSCSKAKN